MGENRLDYQAVFNGVRDSLGYPDWVQLPPRIQIELHHIMENYENDDLLRKASSFMQTDWSCFLADWVQSEQVCKAYRLNGRHDHNFITINTTINTFHLKKLIPLFSFLYPISVQDTSYTHLTLS